MRRVALLAMIGVLLGAPAALAADPSGLTVWKGQGVTDTLLENQRTVRFDHLTQMRFPNDRTVFSTVGGPATYFFIGSAPTEHGRSYEFAVDTIDVVENGARKTYRGNGSCTVDLSPTGGVHAVHHVDCAGDAEGGPSLSMTFIADRTPPDFKSFDPSNHPPIIVEPHGR